ncbi:MAG: hypothetical protein ACI8YC_000532 [Salibacteraceae bacterium]|jgi:hypothetical protein
MNNKFSITIITTLLMLFCSCEPDVLDKQPLDIISEVAVWNDADLVNSYLTQTYAQTYPLTQDCTDDRPNGKSDTWFGWADPIVLSDEARQSWGPGGAGKNGTIRNNSSNILPWWEKAYEVIRSLNVFIELVPSSEDLDDEFKAKRTAEARWLRAFNYFSMVKRYGGVPLITEAQSVDNPDDPSLYPSRNTEKEVYDFIISEVDAIVNDLPDPGATEPGRVSKGAALALKSRAALYAASIANFGTVQLNGVVGINQGEADSYYQKSYDASEALALHYSLFNNYEDKATNFRNIFMDKDHTEVIFAVKHNYENKLGGGNGWSWDFFQTPSPQGWGGGNSSGVYLEMVESFGYKDGTPGTLDINELTSKKWTLDELWGNKDPRFHASVYTQGTVIHGLVTNFYKGLRLPDGSTMINGSYEGVAAKGNQATVGWGRATMFGILKYIEDGKDNFGQRASSGTDYLTFRYGEILLNLAEAAFEIGKTTEALDAINQLRIRAGVANLTEITRDLIRNERKVELAFEGHRYWDLRRWRIAESHLTKSFRGLQYILDYDTRKWHFEIIPTVDGAANQPVFFEQNYYLPISINRIGQNSNLVENPGYN